MVTLVLARADPHIRNSKGCTALQSAAGGGHFEVVLCLVQHGAAWRFKQDLDIVRLICKKSSYKCAPLFPLACSPASCSTDNNVYS